MRVEHYFDYKSPYAYLAQAGMLELAEQPGVELALIPYTLDIPAYLGSARTGDDGTVLEEARNAHQWRRVRYAYMDCRREANRRGLTVRGPRKIFDSRLAHVGFLFLAAEAAIQMRYHHLVFERFWKRELDIEDPVVVAKAISECGGNGDAFGDYAADEGFAILRDMQQRAEDNGVFGVPSYRVNGELYWGAERLERVAEIVG
jgi:2-hydroxychromene-2-carboxylate isomerase